MDGSDVRPAVQNRLLGEGEVDEIGVQTVEKPQEAELLSERIVFEIGVDDGKMRVGRAPVIVVLWLDEDEICIGSVNLLKVV